MNGADSGGRGGFVLGARRGVCGSDVTGVGVGRDVEAMVGSGDSVGAGIEIGVGVSIGVEI
jgi:hypothetical protein